MCVGGCTYLYRMAITKYELRGRGGMGRDGVERRSGNDRI